MGYDPVASQSSYTREYHFNGFPGCAATWKGYTHTCVISFLDIYRKIKGQMERFRPRTMTGEDIVSWHPSWVRRQAWHDHKDMLRGKGFVSSIFRRKMHR